MNQKRESMINIEAILERIDLNPDKTLYEPNLETLKTLTLHYMLNVPYENLDFVYKRDFSVNLFKIYEKIVEQNRGGICYESNTLFTFLLQTLGFNVGMLLAKVDDLSYIGADYPHLCLLVTLDDVDYLVDVGNGQNIREPFPINDQAYISCSEDKEYKINYENSEYILQVKHKRRGWLPRYRFKKELKSIADFENVFAGKTYEDFSVDGPLLVTKALKQGRVTLLNDMVFLKDGELKREWDVDEENRFEVLRDYFDIELQA